MITLSKRLQMIAELVPKCGTAADVGTDHGYLPVWMIQSGTAKRVLASDIGVGPLQRAQATVEQYGLTQQIRTVLADGLQYPEAEQAEVITICGMGGETTVSILSAADWVSGKRLILQPQSKLEELEHWLRQHHFGIRRASLAMDAEKLYLAFEAQPNTPWRFGAEEGLLCSRDPLLKAYLIREQRKAEKALFGMQQSREANSEQITSMQTRLQWILHSLEEAKAW